MLALTEASKVQLLIALMTLTGVVVAAILSYLGNRQAKKINAAVNNVPDGTPPITDRVTAIEKKLDHVMEEKHEDRKLLLSILDIVTKP